MKSTVLQPADLDEAPAIPPRLRSKVAKSVIAMLLAVAISVGLASTASPASASSGTPVFVAHHYGSWGYQEHVFSREVTRQVADSTGLGAAGVVAGYLSVYALPATLLTFLWQAKAREAVNKGQCLAAVGSFWIGPGLYPGITYQDCR